MNVVEFGGACGSIYSRRKTLMTHRNTYYIGLIGLTPASF